MKGRLLPHRDVHLSENTPTIGCESPEIGPLMIRCNLIFKTC